ncbi:E3 ubiquitin-protein ligase TRIM33-like [Cryptotermes secundus]|uniref:E3 ubiquitin-protein ligase TRIM33-like n=1 Tax=Cryptotermes secundus TaxID=105785 RepID=UPI000CD7D874|nr:E3 ubiquitin-protein ligase TRIM33-like [Cryptotermes secundus]
MFFSISSHIEAFETFSSAIQEVDETAIVTKSPSLFCVACDILICQDCLFTDHHHHKYKFIHEIAEETKNMIRGLLSEVRLTDIIITKGRQRVLQATELHYDTQKELKNKKYSCEKLSNMISFRLFTFHKSCREYILT